MANKALLSKLFFAIKELVKPILHETDERVLAGKPSVGSCSHVNPIRGQDFVYIWLIGVGARETLVLSAAYRRGILTSLKGREGSESPSWLPLTNLA